VPISPRTPLVLGSASPRRREILDRLGVAFVVSPARVDESVRPPESADAYLARVARAKLDAVRTALPGGLRASAAALLVADTSVILDGAILGKPADAEEARAMIEALAGRVHEVKTLFLLAPAEGDGAPLHAQTVTTRVFFRALVDGEASAYAASGEGMDKAGGYAAQGRAAAFIERIEGSYTNVVGLPACELVVALRALGLV
jgi:nucleoside triphosphate pyrophosphatase